MEAQKAVLTELEEVKTKLQRMADTDTSRKRFMVLSGELNVAPSVILFVGV